jgi:glycosyltransferase involved in cell wall biosynthesis
MPNPCCIPNGVEWPERHLPLADGPFAVLPRPYALFLGRVTWKKGLDRLLRAWKAVPDLFLVIAGNDEEKHADSLAAIAREEGITNRIRIVGPVSDTHKWALYENAEMLVLPSYSENFGNVVAEAMAVSCPVVVTQGVGLASLVLQRGAGVVAGETPAEIAQAISALHGDAALRRKMGHAGARTAVECLSWSAVATGMESAYLRAMGSSVPWRGTAGAAAVGNGL